MIVDLTLMIVDLTFVNDRRSHILLMILISHCIHVVVVVVVVVVNDS